MTEALYIVLVGMAGVLLVFQVYMLVWTKRQAAPANRVARGLRIFNVVALFAAIVFVIVTQFMMR